MSYFVAFGSFAMLLLVDFRGPIVDRLRAQALLGVACAVLICLGTLASRSTPVAVATMFVVGLRHPLRRRRQLGARRLRRRRCCWRSSCRSAARPGVGDPRPRRRLGSRGRGVAGRRSRCCGRRRPQSGAASGSIAACRALAARLRADVAWLLRRRGRRRDAGARGRDPDGRRGRRRAADPRSSRRPYRPTGLSTDARAVIRLVDELRWLTEVVLSSTPRARPPRPNGPVCAVKTRRRGGARPSARRCSRPRGRGAPEPLAGAAGRGAAALEQRQTAELPVDPPAASCTTAPGGRVRRSTRASVRRSCSFVVDQIAANVDLAAAADAAHLARPARRAPAGGVQRLAHLLRASARSPTPSPTPRGCTTACAAPPGSRWRCSSSS